MKTFLVTNTISSYAKKLLIFGLVVPTIFLFLTNCIQSVNDDDDDDSIMPTPTSTPTATIPPTPTPLVVEIFVDQAGYLPGAPKYFITNAGVQTFEVIANDSNTVAFSAQTTLLRSNDPATAISTYIGDFSDLSADGTYYIKIDDGNTPATSYPFTVHTTVFNDVAKKSIKSFYYQRCGQDLPETYLGEYNHTACHLNDGIFHTQAGVDGTADMTGGWHDAGDYGKYILPGAVTLAIMLMGYEEFPDKYNFDDNNIPESSNGISDLLDEARYELEWMLKMQDQTNGSLPYMLNSQGYSWTTPELDTVIRYIYGYSTLATANFSAIMARAARIYQPIDATFAAKCLAAATLAWQFLSDNPGQIPSEGYERPTDTYTGGYCEYGEDNYEEEDDRTWAAVELFLTTGESAYHDYAKDTIAASDNFNTGYSWMNVMELAKLAYLFGSQTGIDTAIQSTLQQQLISRATAITADVEASGFKVCLEPGEYSWGCNGNLLKEAAYLIFAYTLNGNDSFYNAALSQLHYILGINAHNLSFVTGVGSVAVKNIHHAALENDGIRNPYPGLMAGGPNEFLWDSVLANNFNSNSPPALCYLDDSGSYASNENCILYNAPLVFVAMYFADFN